MKITIAKKIWISLGVLILGYFFSMVLGFVTGRNTENQLTAVLNNLFPATKHSLLAEASFKEQIGFYSDAVLIGDHANIDKAYQKARQVQEALNRIIGLPGLSPEKKDATRQLRERLKDFRQAALTAYTALVNEFEKENLTSFSSPEAEHLAIETEELKKGLADLNESFSKALEAELTQINRRTFRQRYINVALFLVIILCLSVGVFFMITRSITNPLRKIMETAESISMGDFSKEFQIRQEDEIGQLAATFSKMKRIINEVLESMDSLIKAIREGMLDHRGNPDAFSGNWRNLISGTNDLIEAFADPINSSANALEKMSAGEIPETIATKYQGDFNKIKNNLNDLIRNLDRTIEIAKKIADGDLSVEVTPLSAKDSLGKSLATMTRSLKKMTDDSSRENWLKSGLNEVNKRIHGEMDAVIITQNVITFLAGYLEAQVGAFYLADQSDLKKTTQFKLVSSYAYKVRRSNYNEFKLGEGLIGQAALEKKGILFANVPDDHVVYTIDSGVGESFPHHIYVMPMIFTDQVLGVLALGFSREFSQAEIELIDRSSESIAIGLSAAQSRTQMAELLVKTQNQAEKLQIQQEELKAANEELEEQTQLLRQSEEELKAQSEELQVANEELKEKSKTLEARRKEIDQSRKEIQLRARDLEIASKYKSEFLANMSHELRTPLNSMLLFSKMLTDNEENNLTDEQIESLRIVHSSGEDLLNLINDILDLSKIEAGKMDMNFEAVNIGDISKYLNDQFSPVAKDKGVTFVCRVKDDLPETFISDGPRVEQVLRNLISNAIKFTEKGRISVTIGRPDEATSSRLTGLDHESAIAFSVSDTGIGIAEEKQKVIFEAFQQADGTTSRRFGGTGLGLTISQGLTKKLGGMILMNSKEGEGSTFTLILPQQNGDGETALKMAERSDIISEATMEKETPVSPLMQAIDEPAPEELKPATFPDDRTQIAPGDKSILVIEDDLHFSKILKDFIHKRGYKYLAGERGKSGVELAIQYQPMSIILDISLPDMDGLMVLDMLKKNLTTRHIPVHIISARETNSEAMKKGAIGWNKKPTTAKDINLVLSKFEQVLKKSLKEVLIVEDDEANQVALTQLIKSQGVNITVAGDGRHALDLITSNKPDCVILDLGLPDISGFDLLEKLKTEMSDSGESLPPFIIYTGKELSEEEYRHLNQYAKSIVIKGANSPDRLLDEVSLFLHSVESQLPEEQRSVLRMLHDPTKVLENKTILLVDDDLRNTFALSKLLGNYGIKVILADNGLMAIEKLENETDIDLVLMDIMMPVMDGFEAIQRIRKQPRFKKLPIIALTAKAMSTDRDKCIDAGANDYLVKPLDEEKLISVLKIWLFK